MESDPYTVLELDGSVSHDIAEVNKAFRRLALKYHPDKNSKNPHALLMFQAVSRAHDYLLDPSAKEEIDNKIKADFQKVKRYEQQDADTRRMAKSLEERERMAAAARHSTGSGEPGANMAARRRNAQLIQEFEKRLS